MFFDERFANVGNEPGLLQAALYHYAGHPAKSALRTRKLLGPVFNTHFEGLPGNDDAGNDPFRLHRKLMCRLAGSIHCLVDVRVTSHRRTIRLPNSPTLFPRDSIHRNQISDYSR